jgi:hypothetical protein
VLNNITLREIVITVTLKIILILSSRMGVTTLMEDILTRLISIIQDEDLARTM